MSKFKKKTSKKMASVSTASLPDIVFMLLFFFMVATTMKKADLMVKVKKPEATAVTRLENASLIDHIYVGPSLYPEKHGSEPIIQLDDKIASSPIEVQAFINDKREMRKEWELPYVATSLKVDAATKMYIVTVIKEQLREAEAFKIMFSTRKK